MKATIVINTESKSNALVRIDHAMIKMARHDGVSLPILLRVELLKALKEYSDYNNGVKGTRYDKYAFKKSA